MWTHDIRNENLLHGCKINDTQIVWHPDPIIFPDGTAEWEIGKILEARHGTAEMEYLVSWKGYEAEFDTWEPIQALHNTEALERFLGHRK